MTALQMEVVAVAVSSLLLFPALVLISLLH
jgi:hypothetical protein